MKEVAIHTPQMVVQERVVLSHEISKTTVMPFRLPEMHTNSLPIEQGLVKREEKTPHDPGGNDLFLKDDEMPIIAIDTLSKPVISDEQNLVNSTQEKGEEVIENPNSLEEGFKTLEAQKAYYEFMESVRLVDIKTGNGAQRLVKAIDKVEKHAEEMAIPRLLAIMAVTIPLLVDDWTKNLRKKEDEEQKEVVQTKEEGGEEKEESSPEKELQLKLRETNSLPQQSVLSRVA